MHLVIVDMMRGLTFFLLVAASHVAVASKQGETARANPIRKVGTISQALSGSAFLGTGGRAEYFNPMHL